MTDRHGDVERLRAELRHLLGRAVTWLDALAKLEVEFDEAQQEDWTESLRDIRALRARAASTLLTVAFVGKFSSGKSFLIGGLQEQLTYAPVTNHDGMLSEQYVGLLHSASRASTHCPVTIVPVDDDWEVDASDRGFYRVRFDGDDTWEGLGNSPVPAVVAAYTTQDPQAVARGRATAHLDRVVAQVEILLADSVLPAKLYELPGTDSPYPIHDEIAANAWLDADCFVYVSQATHTLDRRELDLITRLYKHHLRSGKRIIWVLTGIDRAVSTNLDGEPEWLDTIRDNNAYLAENFPAVAGRLDTFQGDGFVGVSPAWEAQGRWHLAQGDTSQGEKLISASRMRPLRRILTELIDAGTGREHLLTVAREARVLLMPHQRRLVDLLESARMPLDGLSSEHDDLGRRLAVLRSAINAIHERFQTLLRHHIKVTDRSFHGLADLLRIELVDEINAANLKSEKEVNRLEIRKAQILQEWVAEHGPERVWREQFSEFSRNVLATVQAALRDADRANGFGADAARVDLADLAVYPARRYRPNARDVLQQLAGFVGIYTPVATAIAAAAGLITGPVLAVPASVALAAGVIYAYIARSRADVSEIKALRQQWIDDLEETARTYRGAFIAAAQLSGTETIDRAMEILSERAEELSRRILLVETRLAEPDYADLSDLVATLDPQVRYGAALLESLRTMG